MSKITFPRGMGKSTLFLQNRIKELKEYGLQINDFRERLKGLDLYNDQSWMSDERINSLIERALDLHNESTLFLSDILDYIYEREHKKIEEKALKLDMEEEQRNRNNKPVKLIIKDAVNSSFKAKYGPEYEAGMKQYKSIIRR